AHGAPELGLGHLEIELRRRIVRGLHRGSSRQALRARERRPQGCRHRRRHEFAAPEPHDRLLAQLDDGTIAGMHRLVKPADRSPQNRTLNRARRPLSMSSNRLSSSWLFSCWKKYVKW